MASATVYTKAASFYHWAVAAPLIGSVACVLKAQDIPKEQKEEKMKWMWRHKSLGLLTGLIVFPRVGYRLLNMSKYNIRELPGEGPVSSVLAKGTHLGLYAFMTIMPATGIAMGMYGGNGLPFFWTTIPGFEQKNGKLAGQVSSKGSTIFVCIALCSYWSDISTPDSNEV
jgi:cytochrome b561